MGTTGEEDEEAGGWLYYESDTGAEPIIREMKKSQITDAEAVRLQVLLDRVATGDALPADTAQVRGEIWEVRFSGDNRRIFRLLYATVGRDRLLLGLHFFKKKTRTTPPASIKLAKKRLADWRKQQR